MAVPSINTTTSVLGYRRGQSFSYQMNATNSPTSWGAEGLPDGLTIDDDGLITGAATTAGVYLISVTATNGDGASDPLVIAMGIEESAYNDGLGIEVNIDLRTGAVSVPGVTVTDDKSPILFLKNNDVLFLDLGFLKGEVLQEMNVVLAKLALREYADERQIMETAGEVQVVGTSDQPRYRIAVELTDPKIAQTLGSYTGDRGVTFNAVAEIEWHVTYLDPEAILSDLNRTTKTFPVALDMDFIE